ncbi:MAG TPA: methylenetetrahydrofolate reductase [Beutenbergiaceae bacterium]|nr:methylenetetrahydrofolate reductase [Beutenbergiaceae bacterium]
MSTADLFSVPLDRPTISFELYPPRSQKGAAKLDRTVTELAAAGPDFFSITYGAAGKTRDSSRDLVRQIITDTGVAPIAHLTCVGASRAELRAVIEDLLSEGVRDFLALRGDPPAGDAHWRPHPEGLHRASELVHLLRELESEAFGRSQPAGRLPRPSGNDGAFGLAAGAPASAGGACGPGAQAQSLSISVAAYPGGRYDRAGQPEVCPNDIAALVEKQKAGADFAITQLFFDARHYAELVRLARQAGVHIPILAGVIPLTDPNRLRRLHDLTGVPIPPRLLDLLDSAPTREEAYRRGLQVSKDLLTEVLAAGAPGLHVYTFNSAAPSLDLLHSVGLVSTPSLS